ncbi:hypothetical protein N9W79_00155 [bacterium]|nr:hypothetical protein [bacterium]
MEESYTYARESWSGDSRDGALEDGDGYHFFRLKDGKLIVEAYEYYESDEGVEVATPLPEMKNVDWLNDLGFEDLDTLDIISESEFEAIKEIVDSTKKN